MCAPTSTTPRLRSKVLNTTSSSPHMYDTLNTQTFDAQLTRASWNRTGAFSSARAAPTSCAKRQKHTSISSNMARLQASPRNFLNFSSGTHFYEPITFLHHKAQFSRRMAHMLGPGMSVGCVLIIRFVTFTVHAFCFLSCLAACLA